MHSGRGLLMLHIRARVSGWGRSGLVFCCYVGVGRYGGLFDMSGEPKMGAV